MYTNGYQRDTMEKNKRKGSLETNLNFTAGDLEANKAGFISHRQQQKLLRLCILSQEFLWYPALILFFWGIAIFVALNASISIPVRVSVSIIVGLLGMGIAYGPFWIGHLQPYVQDLHKKKIKRVYRPQGQDYYTIGASRHYIMQPANASRVLSTDTAYWLYFAAESSVLLSAEIARK